MRVFISLNISLPLVIFDKKALVLLMNDVTNIKPYEAPVASIRCLDDPKYKRLKMRINVKITDPRLSKASM